MLMRDWDFSSLVYISLPGSLDSAAFIFLDCIV